MLSLAQGIDRLKGFVDSHALIKPTDRLLLAVSGGVDSMCMLEILSRMQMDITVAHVNYQLRGEDSDADEAFVQEYCAQKNTPCFTTKAATTGYAEANKLSIQEAARAIRYDWFDNLCSDQNIDVIVTAHHINDSVETFFINLIRGTGIKGLTGIPVRRDNVIRPMLCFTRAEIEQMAHKDGVPFREDRSNSEFTYLRNRVRHEILPLFESLEAGFMQRMNKNIWRLHEENAFILRALESAGERALQDDGNYVKVVLAVVIKAPSPTLMLLHLLQPYGFNLDQCLDILGGPHQPGSRFLSSTHELIVDRSELIIAEIETKEAMAEVITGEGAVQTAYGTLKIEHAEAPKSYPQDPNTEYIDAAKIRSTCVIRNWEAGDKFQPLGMQGTQKVQDFLTNARITLADKRRTLVLVHENDIVWLIGHRIDDRFKVNAYTEKVLRLEWIKG